MNEKLIETQKINELPVVDKLEDGDYLVSVVNGKTTILPYKNIQSGLLNRMEINLNSIPENGWLSIGKFYPKLVIVDTDKGRVGNTYALVYVTYNKLTVLHKGDYCSVNNMPTTQPGIGIKLEEGLLKISRGLWTDATAQVYITIF